MAKIAEKLHSKRGASLLLAMMFMFVCLFIGGTVLAAATANGGRVANAATDQQTFLSQRSAAMVIANQLQGTTQAPLQLTIKAVTNTVPAAEADGSPTASTAYQFSLPYDPMNPVTRSSLQRILIENALSKYRIQQEIGPGGTYSGFSFENVTGIYDPNSTLYSQNSGTFEVHDPAGTTLTAMFTFPEYTKDLTLTSEMFEMNILFVDPTQGISELPDGDEGEEEEDPAATADTYSMMRIRVKATYSVSEPAVVTNPDGSTTSTVTTVIRWDAPQIEKGGA